MPKYIVGYELSSIGNSVEDEVEASSLEEAEKLAWELAMQELCSWAEEIQEDQE